MLSQGPVAKGAMNRVKRLEGLQKTISCPKQKKQIASKLSKAKTEMSNNDN